MKIKEGFVLKKVCGQNVIVATGIKNIDFNSVIALNESAALIYETISSKENFTVEDMVAALTKEYEVDDVTARRDCESLLAEWQQNGIITENK